MRKRVFSTSSGALIAFVDTLGETSIFWTFSNPVSKTVSLLFHFNLKKSICNFSTVSLSSYVILRFMMKSIMILNQIFLTVVRDLYQLGVRDLRGDARFSPSVGSG